MQKIEKRMAQVTAVMLLPAAALRHVRWSGCVSYLGVWLEK